MSDNTYEWQSTDSWADIGEGDRLPNWPDAWSRGTIENLRTDLRVYESRPATFAYRVRDPETGDIVTHEEMAPEQREQWIAEQKAIADAKARFRAHCEELGLSADSVMRRLQRRRPARPKGE